MQLLYSDWPDSGYGRPMTVQGSPKGTDGAINDRHFFLTLHYDPLQNFVFAGYWLLSLYKSHHN